MTKKTKTKPTRRLVVLDVEALKFSLSSVMDDRNRGQNAEIWGARYDVAIQHLKDLIRLAVRK